MSEQHTSAIERILRRIEDHIEEWRHQDRLHKAEADANRDRLWAEASERENLLKRTINEEEANKDSLGKITKQHRVAFVVHSDEVAQTLEKFARDRDQLVRVIPGRGTHSNSSGLKGSWLIFEAPK